MNSSTTRCAVDHLDARLGSPATNNESLARLGNDDAASALLARQDLQHKIAIRDISEETGDVYLVVAGQSNVLDAVGNQALLAQGRGILVGANEHFGLGSLESNKK
jgi:hypothetical protein